MNKPLRKIIYMVDTSYSLLPLKIYLQKHYELFPVQTTAGLYETLGSVTADLILLDIFMPGADSFGIIAALKTNPHFGGIPVVCVSAKHDSAALSKVLGLGAADLLVKPFSEKELYKRIENQWVSEKSEEYMPVVLTVDDSASVLRMINGLLCKRYKVHTLSRSEMLKTLLHRIEPDLFLLDCNMPGLSGFDLVPIIRSIPRHLKTPIIFLTADGTVDTFTRTINLGANDFMVKPISETVLHEKAAAHASDYMIIRSLRNIAG